MTGLPPLADALMVEVPGLPSPIWLIRHAPTDWTGQRWCGRADPPLSRAGRAAADDLARTVAAAADFEIGATIRSSPAQRARATAGAIAAVTDWEIAVDDDLLEVDVGLVEGLTWPELEAQFPVLAAAIGRGERVDWPGGEAMSVVDDRARRAAGRLLEAASRGPVVVVSHGALLHVLAGVVAPAWTPSFFGPGGSLRLLPATR